MSRTRDEKEAVYQNFLQLVDGVELDYYKRPPERIKLDRPPAGVHGPYPIPADCVLWVNGVLATFIKTDRANAGYVHVRFLKSKKYAVLTRSECSIVFWPSRSHRKPVESRQAVITCPVLFWADERERPAGEPIVKEWKVLLYAGNKSDCGTWLETTDAQTTKTHVVSRRWVQPVTEILSRPFLISLDVKLAKTIQGRSRFAGLFLQSLGKDTTPQTLHEERMLDRWISKAKVSEDFNTVIDSVLGALDIETRKKKRKRNSKPATRRQHKNKRAPSPNQNTLL